VTNATITDLEEEERMDRLYLDLTGRFPTKLQQGNLYILILYTYDDNAILAEPLKPEGMQTNSRHTRQS
jgi:hypothetical protein